MQGQQLCKLMTQRVSIDKLIDRVGTTLYIAVPRRGVHTYLDTQAKFICSRAQQPTSGLAAERCKPHTHTHATACCTRTAAACARVEAQFFQYVCYNACSTHQHSKTELLAQTKGTTLDLAAKLKPTWKRLVNMQAIVHRF
jgi:hypothetical protein